MSETALTFGVQNNLIGIVSEPEAQVPRAHPNVLILNAGLNHKVGPFRMSVDLARQLAGNGFRVLRFDSSGFGDSKMRLVSREAEDLSVTDVREAMDALQQRFGTEGLS